MKKFLYYIVAALIVTVSIFVLAPRIGGNAERATTSPVSNTEIAVTFSIEDATYPLDIRESSTIYEAMRTLASTTPFRFVASYFNELGYFIENINGIPNNDGYYWTLYVNGTYSPVGVSTYRLKAGDRVEWRFEKK